MIDNPKFLDSKVGPLAVRSVAPNEIVVSGEAFTLNRVDYRPWSLRCTYRLVLKGWFVTSGPHLVRANGNWRAPIPHTCSQTVISESRRVAALAAQDGAWLLEGELASFDARIADANEKIVDLLDDIRTIENEKVEHRATRLEAA